MAREINETKLFRIMTTLCVYPIFYLQASDIVDATKQAKEIVDYFSNDKVVGTVTEVSVPMLSLVEDSSNG